MLKAKSDGDSSQKTIQILNILGYIIGMIFNGLSSTKMPRSLRSITDEWQLRIAPANYAFAIWGLIYTLLMIFVIYQALPDEWVPSRNNTLIFNEIGYQFFINMMVNSVWLVLFQTGKRWGFVLGLIDI